MTFFWLLTDFCNLNCKYCFYNIWIEKKNKDFDFFMIDKYINFLEKTKTKKIILSWWEILRKDFYKKTIYICKELEKKHIIYNIDTNLVYLNSEIINFFKKTKYLNMLYISLDSTNSITNNYLRWKTNKVLENIKKLKKNWIKFSILLTLTKKNINDLSNTLKSLQKSETIVKPVFIPEKNKEYSKLMLDESIDYDNLNKLLKKYINNTNLSKNLDKFYDLWTNYYNTKKIKKAIKSNINCPMWENFFVIFTDWIIKNCFHTDEIIGNILTNDYDHMIDKLKNKKYYTNLPKCFSKQCISLFSMNEFWNETIN